jgi:integrase
MHDLIPIGPSALPDLGALTTAEVAATMAYAAAEKATATREAYATDWRQFAEWCDQRGACPLPARAGLVAAFLAHLADSGRRSSTIGRKAAAIGYRHKMAGVDPLPTASEGVKATLRGIRRTIGAAPQGKAPAVAEVITKMVALCDPATMIGRRDIGLLSFGFASACRRSELAALLVSDLEEVADGLRVTIRRSKGDQEGLGQQIAIPRGYYLRPVEALQTWLAAAEITSGPVFRSVKLGGKVSDAALSSDAFSRIVKKHAERIGLDPAAFGAHSMRSGFLTSSAESGASIFKMMEQSRHRSMDTLKNYIRARDLFREHAGAAFL